MDPLERAANALEETNKIVLEKVNTLEKWLAEVSKRGADTRSSVSAFGGTHGLHEAIPEFERWQLGRAEIVCEQQRAARARTGRHVGLFPDDPVLKVAAGLYFQGRLMQLTKPGEFYAFRENHERIIQALGGRPEIRGAMGETTTGTGVELVPTVVQAEILRQVADNSVMRRAGVRVIPMTTKTHAWPVRNQAITAAIKAEAATGVDSIGASPFTQTNLTAKTLFGFATVSSELLQDNVVALADYLAQEFGEQFGRLEDGQGLEGDGAGNNYTGLVAASGVNAVTSGANGDAVNYRLLIDAIFAGVEGSSRDGGALFMHPKTWGAILKTRTDSITAADGAGPSLITPSGGPLLGVPRTFMGYPVWLTSAVSITRTVGTSTDCTNVYFGPPESIVFGDLLDFQIDLNPYGKFQSFQVDIRGVKRVGILVGVPVNFTKYTAIRTGQVMKP